MITKQNFKLNVSVEYKNGNIRNFEFVCTPYGENVIRKIKDAELSLILTEETEKIEQTIKIKE
jgi:hypothetical protein